MRPFPGHGMGSMLAGFLGFIGTLTFLALVALLIFFLVKRAKGGRDPRAAGFVGHHPHHRPPMPPALQVLDERLARGEIEVEDYLSRRAALTGEQTRPQPNEWTPGQPAPTPSEQTGPPADDPQI